MAATDVLKELVIEGVEGLYDDGLVHHPGKQDDGKGGYTRDPPDPVPCKLKIDSVTDDMREELGFTEKDVALYILQTSGLVVTEEDEVTDENGQRYSLGTLKTDPVNSHWFVRGTPING